MMTMTGSHTVHCLHLTTILLVLCCTNRSIDGLTFRSSAASTIIPKARTTITTCCYCEHRKRQSSSVNFDNNMCSRPHFMVPPAAGHDNLRSSMMRRYSAKSSGDGGGGDNDEHEEIISTESYITKLLATPIKVLPNKKPIALVYPLALLGASAFLPASTAFLLDAFFAGFWLLGRNVIDEDDDDDDYDSELSMSNMIDLAALAGAIVSAGLLAPDSISNEASNNFCEGLGVTAISLAAAAVASAIASENDDVASDAAVDTQTRKEVIDPIQQEMLDSWDRKLRGGDISEGLSKDEEQGSSRRRRR
mmetsp:Transcript_8307/g.12303  ORF Transcript_8307/g.12303 Transcript_8307/m.12303 type:complete len:306 (-) Transcript_8307:1139-2056(-)